MNRRIKGFIFKLHTSFWSLDPLGYESILEQGHKNTKIYFLVDGKPSYILIDNEKEFIDKISEINVYEWNNKGFYNLTEDAWYWKLEMYIDDQEIITGGVGGFPKNFYEFMRLLHDDYGLEYSILDKDKKIKGKNITLKWYLKGTEIVPYEEISNYL